MSDFRQGMVSFGVAVALCVTSATVWADGQSNEQASILDNLYVDLTGGGEKPSGEDATAMGSVGVNWGIPIIGPTDGIALGAQLGGDAKLREDDAEFDATGGFFARNLKSFEHQQAAVALLVDYRRTAFHNSILALRPVVGTTLNERDAVGLTGVAGVMRDSTRSGNDIIRQEAIDRVEAFWNREWSDHIVTEISAGYQLSHIDEGLFGGQIAWGATPHCDLAVGGEINTAGNYAVGVSASYHFGGTGRHATIHNIRGSGATLYTPFPKRSFPAMMHRTWDDYRGKNAPSGGTGGDTGGSTGGSTGGDTGGSTGGDTGGSTGGSTGGDTGGASTGGDTGGSTGGDPGGSTGGSTGGDSGGSTGGDTGGSTGGSTGGDGGGTTCGDTGGHGHGHGDDDGCSDCGDFHHWHDHGDHGGCSGCEDPQPPHDLPSHGDPCFDFGNEPGHNIED